MSGHITGTSTGAQAAHRTVARVVFPADADGDRLPLYIDFTAHTSAAAARTAGSWGAGEDDARTAVAAPLTLHEDYVLDRRRVCVPASERVSFATYFNAFPAGYWRRWTPVTQVRLTVRVSGSGTLFVYRSTARGAQQRVDVRRVADQELVLDLPLRAFGDGGWYWFDLAGGEEAVTLEEASWSVPAASARRGEAVGRLSVAITTYDRPEFCIAQMRSLARAPEVLEHVDQLVYVDQGSKRVVEEPDYAEASGALAGVVRVLEQENVGGSGGFARGMYEALQAGSDYVVLLDDDVSLETESFLRALHFADFTRKPTLVGGHMLNLYEPSVLMNFGERVDPWRFLWQPTRGFEEPISFARSNLRAVPRLHRRVDVDYNAWWMCTIPTEVVRDVGLALPVFIKWDDAEYGLRAGEAGYPTVSLPGAAVWHMPFVDKDDATDWQAYYHQRNRWVAALLHSPYDRGGRLWRESFMRDVKHLLALQYSAVELRHRALQDLLRGPGHLHPDLAAKILEVRSTRKQFPDAQVAPDLAAFPPPRRSRPPRRGKEVQAPRSMRAGVAMALAGAVRQVRPLAPLAREHPQTTIAAMDAQWWYLAQFDSAVVSTADGTGASWYRREPREFRRLVARSLDLHQELARRWPALREEYCNALDDVVSVETWEKTFAEISREGA